MVYKYNRILWSLNQGGNSTIWDADELWEHYTKWNKPVTERQILWFHSYEVSKVVKVIETEWHGSRGNTERLVEVYKL